jgi:hypothetical protein
VLAENRPKRLDQKTERVRQISPVNERDARAGSFRYRGVIIPESLGGIIPLQLGAFVGIGKFYIGGRYGEDYT